MRILFINPVKENTAQQYSNFIKQSVISTLKNNNNLHEAKHIVLKKLSFQQFRYNGDLLITIENQIAGNPLLKWWYKILLPSFVKKQKIDVVIHFHHAFNKRICVPQHIVLPGIFNKKQSATFYKNNAKSFIVPNDFYKKLAIKNWNTEADLIKVISPFTEEHPEQLAWEEREEIKNEHSEGNEYFLIKGIETKETFIEVLKGFSSFKKWQQSKMNVIVIIENKKLLEECFLKLQGYKYYTSVKRLTGTKEQQVNLLRACYAFIYACKKEEDFFPVYEAFKNGVPVIAPFAKYMEGFTEKPVLLCDTDNNEDLGKALINIYKGEVLRNRLIQAGYKEYEKVFMPGAYDKLWGIIKNDFNT